MDALLVGWGVEHFGDPLALYEMDRDRRRVFVGWQMAKSKQRRKPTPPPRANRAPIPTEGISFASDEARQRSAGCWVE